MTIEITNLQNSTNPAITYSECYAQPFCQLYHGDCLVEMDKIKDKSIDMILCDLPYSVTQNKWDILIPFEPLWKQYERIIKETGIIVLTGQQPFTSALVMSNLKMFRYECIWDKVATNGFLNAKYMPLKRHENILVFYKNKGTYNPQKTQRTEKEIRRGWKDKTYNFIGKKYEKSNYGIVSQNVSDDYEYDKKHPNSIITVSNGNGWTKKKSVHPTQKPTELFEILIKTYTNEFDTVLDNCMGSGTTGVACKNLNRKFIGIEKDEQYFNLAKKRIESHTVQSELF